MYICMYERSNKFCKYCRDTDRQREREITMLYVYVCVVRYDTYVYQQHWIIFISIQLKSYVTISIERRENAQEHEFWLIVSWIQHPSMYVCTSMYVITFHLRTFNYMERLYVCTVFLIYVVLYVYME